MKEGKPMTEYSNNNFSEITFGRKSV
ncbi:nitroreductase family protein, partial [Enterococcus faecalis]